METVPPRDQENERLLSIVFNLSPTEAAILSCLYRGTGAPASVLVEYVNVTSSIKPFVSRCRAKLRLKGLDIKSRAGTGYWMEPDDCCKVGKLVADYLGGNNVAVQS